MSNKIIAHNYSEIKAYHNFRSQIRTISRNGFIFVTSSLMKRNASREWIRFPFYHHVFDDERKGFERQLRYLKNYGDFISLNDAVQILKENKNIGGRYYCISFDDGFKNCATNALGILLDHNCCAAFFIPTGFIGKQLKNDRNQILEFFYRSSYPSQIIIEFMDWNDCRRLRDFGMIIGAHTCRHVPLSMLTIEEARNEMISSKKKIELELGEECIHFSSPWGIPGNDFNTNIHPDLANKLGFQSFLTTERGANYASTNPLMIKRDFLFANWQNYQLRYLLL